MIKSFKQFSEESKKEVVFTFGRFNPPTVGHGKLIQKVASASTGNQYRIYASQSSDPKKNPLNYKEKIRVMRKMFPKHGRNIIEDKNAKTAMHIASILHDQGFTKITMVVGSDRISEFTKLLKKYNGVEGRHGFYDFRDGIDVISAGERDPDAEGVEGMSASKMRQAAIDGDFSAFSQGLPKKYGEDMTLFNLIRKRMGLKEKVSFRKHVQLPSLSEKREKYISQEIFNVGDTAITESNEEIIISERKTNYIVDTKNKKHFVENLSPAYKKGLSKSTSAKRQAQFNKQAKMDDDDPNAYKKAPGDARAKTKPSKHTKAYHKKYGKEESKALSVGSMELVKAYKKLTPLEEKQIAGIKKKAEESGIAYGILKKVFDRGMAAWKTGHRPGATPHQWAYARINSFITGGKTRTTADKDLWAKHKGKSESIEEDINCPPATQDLNINTKNRDATIKEYNYGPLNVDEPGDYWKNIADYWNTTEEAAKKSACANCVAFDISERMKDCMPGETSDKDGELGYCWMHHFKCHSARSCHTWAKGGPISDNEKSADWQDRSSLNEGPGEYKGETWEDGYKRRVVKTDKPEHTEDGYKWRIKGKERDEISIKLYKKKPDFDEFKKQMKRVAGHEFGG